MKIFYISGFDGNQNSETFKKISEKYNKTIFINYDNKDAEIAAKQIEEQIKNTTSNNLIIGQSLCGFWVEYFTLKFGFKLIVITQV